MANLYIDVCHQRLVLKAQQDGVALLEIGGRVLDLIGLGREQHPALSVLVLLAQALRQQRMPGESLLQLRQLGAFDLHSGSLRSVLGLDVNVEGAGVRR